jgi:hypothetical protein
MLPCRVLNQSTARTEATLLARHLAIPPRSCHNPKSPILFFQSLTHSSQFAKRAISSIFYTLRTLCQKRRGVPVDCAVNFSPTNESHLTPIESVSLTNLSSKPFGVLLFQKVAPVIPFESYCFANGGEGGGSGNSPSPAERNVKRQGVRTTGQTSTLPTRPLGQRLLFRSTGITHLSTFPHLTSARPLPGGKVWLLTLQRFLPAGGCKR